MPSAPGSGEANRSASELDARLEAALSNGPFEDALLLAMQRSRLTLERISAKLASQGHRVSTTTLSNWQRGRTRPHRAASVAALEALERVLGIGEGRLAALLAQGSARRGPSSHPRSSQALQSRRPAELVAPASALARLQQRIGEERLTRHESLNIEETHILGSDGVPVRHATRQVVRARRPGLSCYYFFFLTHDGRQRDEPPPRVVPMAGCRLGEVLFEPPDVACCELCFDREIPVGATHLFEYATELRYADEAPPPEFRRALSRPLEQMLFRIVFHPDRLPERVSAYTWASPDAPGVEIAELALDDRGTAHHLFLHPGPGIYGIRWRWPDDGRPTTTGGRSAQRDNGKADAARSHAGTPGIDSLLGKWSRLRPAPGGPSRGD